MQGVVIEKDAPPINWSTPPTPDEILDAYEAGKNRQTNVYQRIFTENLKVACEESEKVYHALIKIGVSECFLRLKFNDYSDFEALFIIDKPSYLSDKRKEAYKIASDVEKENKSDTFNLVITIMANSDSLNPNKLVSHGFGMSYNPSKGRNVKKTRSRKTQ